MIALDTGGTSKSLGPNLPARQLQVGWGGAPNVPPLLQMQSRGRAPSSPDVVLPVGLLHPLHGRHLPAFLGVCPTSSLKTSHLSVVRSTNLESRCVFL